MYLWMKDILMVTYTPKGWDGVKKWDYVSELINVLFSRNLERLILTKVNIDVFVSEVHVNGNL